MGKKRMYFTCVALVSLALPVRVTGRIRPRMAPAGSTSMTSA